MGAGRGRRTGLILIVLIIVVLGIGVAAVFIMSGRGGPSEAEEVPGVTPSPSPTPIPTTITIIVAARDINRGTQLTVQNPQDIQVKTMDWPDDPDTLQLGDPYMPGMLIINEEQGLGLDQVEGRVARVDILAGQPVLDFMLMPADQPTEYDDGSDAALLIPSGYVAMAFPLNETSSVAYALRSGDHVDILMSFMFVDVDEEFQTATPNNVGVVVLPSDLVYEGGIEGFRIVGREEDGPFRTKLLVIPGETQQRPRQTTQLVIDNAVILRVGTWPIGDLTEPIVVTIPAPTPVPQEGEEGEEGVQEQPPPPPPTPTPTPPTIVTLVMTRQDALVLKYAKETGAVIDIVLRSALDDNRDDFITDPVTLKYIVDTYTLTPPKLPIAQEPRIDLLHSLLLEALFEGGGLLEEGPPG